MNPGFLIVLSLIAEIAIGSIVKTVIPSFVRSDVFEFIYIPVSTFITIFLPSYLFLNKNKKSYFTDFAEKIRFDRFIIIAVLIGFCAQFAAIIANLPANILISEAGGKTGSKIPDINSLPAFFAALFSFALVPALCEEILFRGIILGYFRQYGDRPAVIISALLFALAHLSYTNIAGTFVMGLVFGFLFVNSNRLIYPFITHFSLNSLAVIISYFVGRNAIASTFYSDYFLVFIIVSIPLGFYLLKTFADNVTKYDYSDMDKYNYVSEFVFDIDEENCIKIYEHDIKENNLKLAFAELVKSPYFYLIIVIFFYIGGSVLW